MPLYDFECIRCGWEGEKFAAMDARHTQACPSCGSSPLDIVFRPQPRYVPFQHYFDIGLGEDINSWGQRRKIMREQHCDHRDPPSKGDASARLDKVHERKKRRSLTGR